MGRRPRRRAACPAASLAASSGAPASGQSMPSAGSFHSSVRSCSGIPVVGGLVEELGGLGQHEEAVREARAAPRASAGSPPTASTPTQRPNVGETAAQVDRDVEHLAVDARARACPARARSGSAGRAARRGASASGCPARTSASMPAAAKRARVPALEEEAALVAEHARLDQHDVGERGRRDLHRHAPARAAARAGTGRSRSSPAPGRAARRCAASM